MPTKNKVAYIIPLHIATPVALEKLKSAVQSHTQQIVKDSILFVACSEEHKQVVSKVVGDKAGIITVSGTGIPSFQKLVNAGIDHVVVNDTAHWIYFLEYDDELMPKANELLDKYSSRFEDVQIFAGLSMVARVVPKPDGKGIAFANAGVANEAMWAPGLAEEMGFLDFNMMLRNNFLFVTSSFYKAEIFETVGKFKEVLQYFADYEFALRAVYNGIVCRGIPKAVAYHHLYPGGQNDPLDNPAVETIKTLDPKVHEFWLSTARKEYFFPSERPITLPDFEATAD